MTCWPAPAVVTERYQERVYRDPRARGLSPGQFTKRWGSIDKIAVPRVPLATFWAIISAITLIGIIPDLAWAVTLRRQMKRFINKGITPLWNSTGAVAAALAPGVAS